MGIGITDLGSHLISQTPLRKRRESSLMTVPLSSHQLLGQFSPTEPVSDALGVNRKFVGLETKELYTGPKFAASYLNVFGLFMCQVGVHSSLPPGRVAEGPKQHNTKAPVIREGSGLHTFISQSSSQ